MTEDNAYQLADQKVRVDLVASLTMPGLNAGFIPRVNKSPLA